MASQGPLYPGAAANDASFGSVAWGTPNSALTDDGGESSAIFAAAGQSNYLKVTSFGLAIPVGATIDGIQVDVKQRSSSATVVTTARARLVRAGTIETFNKTSGSWLQTAGYVAYGGPADLWGAAWTPADINNANFGFVIAVDNNSGTVTAFIDTVRITVTYTGGMSAQSKFKPLLGVG